MPAVVRTNLGSLWAYVQTKAEGQSPGLSATLAARLPSDLHAVLNGDLPRQSDATLLDWEQASYAYLAPSYFVEVVRATLSPPGLSPSHAQPLSFDAALQRLAQASHKARSAFSRAFAAPQNTTTTFRLARAGDGQPLRVTDWAHTLAAQSKDLLSDDGSPFTYPIYKSMGAWAVGAAGQVHLEFARMPFDKLYCDRDPRSHADGGARDGGGCPFHNTGWVSAQQALASYRTWVQQVQGMLSAGARGDAAVCAR